LGLVNVWIASIAFCLLSVQFSGIFGLEFQSGVDDLAILPTVLSVVKSEVVSYVIIYGKKVRIQAPAHHNCTIHQMPIGVLSGYPERRQRVRNAWAKDQCVYFMVAKKRGEWPVEEAEKYNDVILLDLNEEYAGEFSVLPYKTALWFVLAHEWFPEAGHVLKTDDDSNVDVEGLNRELQRLVPDYWGKVWSNVRPIRDLNHRYYVSPQQWRNKTVFPDYCSGAGYALSTKARKCLVSRIADETFLPMEDAATGVTLKACGIQPTATRLVDAMGSFRPKKKWLIQHYVGKKGL
jgi:hypothetical protein